MADTTDARTRTDEPRRGGMLRETRDSFAAVFANRSLRRIELAFAGSAVGDWAYTTAIAVWVYGQGGAKALGVWMAIRATLTAGSTPFCASLCVATTGLLSVCRLMPVGVRTRGVCVRDQHDGCTDQHQILGNELAVRGEQQRVVVTEHQRWQHHEGQEGSTQMRREYRQHQTQRKTRDESEPEQNLDRAQRRHDHLGATHGRVPATMSATGEAPATFRPPNQMNSTPIRMRSAGRESGLRSSAPRSTP